MGDLSEYSGVYCPDFKKNFYNYIIHYNYINSIVIKYVPEDHPFFKGVIQTVELNHKEDEETNNLSLQSTHHRRFSHDTE